MQDGRFFASDNAAGVHPDLLAAIERANRGHALAYGHDPWTESAVTRFRAEFGEQTQVLFVFGGTGANIVGLRSAVDSFEAVICSDWSHLWLDECAAPERLVGKLIPARVDELGKLTVEAVRRHVSGAGVVHHAQVKAISISQSTEWGTVYTPDEIRTLSDFAHEHGLIMHVDGARLCNAAAHLGVPLRALGPDAGVDVMSFGGTKLGLLFGEAVLFFDPSLARNAGFHRKQTTQLASKMRFISAQFEALLANGLWLESARHANRMARRLADAIAPIPGVEVICPVESNGVFPRLPREHISDLQKRCFFHLWDPQVPIARLMTAWDTTESDVDDFAAAMHSAVSAV